jgi:hypothetical protein
MRVVATGRARDVVCVPGIHGRVWQGDPIGHIQREDACAGTKPGKTGADALWLVAVVGHHDLGGGGGKEVGYRLGLWGDGDDRPSASGKEEADRIARVTGAGDEHRNRHWVA